MSEIEFHTDDEWTEAVNDELAKSNSSRLEKKVVRILELASDVQGHVYNVRLNVLYDDSEKLTVVKVRPKEGTGWMVEGENTTGRLFCILGPRGGARRLEYEDDFSNYSIDYSNESNMWRRFFSRVERLDTPKEDTNDEETEEKTDEEDSEDEEQELVADGGQEEIKVRFTGKSRRMYSTRQIMPAFEDGEEKAQIARPCDTRQKTQLVIRTEEEAEATLNHLNRHLDRCDETGSYGTVWAEPGMSKAVRRVIETIESEMSGRGWGEGEKSTEEPTEQSESESGDTPDYEIELSDEAAAAIQTAFNEQEKYSTGRDYHPNNNPTVHPHDREMVIEVLENLRDILEKSEGEPTLHDPNGDDEYLSWVRKALSELSEESEEELVTDGGQEIHRDYRSGGKLAGELADEFGSLEKREATGDTFTVCYEGCMGSKITDMASKHGFRVSYIGHILVEFERIEGHHTDPRTDASDGNGGNKLVTDGGVPREDVEYDAIWDLQKRWNMSFDEAEVYLEDIGYFDYLDDREKHMFYEDFMAALERYEDFSGCHVHIDYLSAASGYDSIKTIEATAGAHWDMGLIVYRDDGTKMSVECVPETSNPYGEIVVKTNGRKVGKITKQEHDLAIFRDKE